MSKQDTNFISNISYMTGMIEAWIRFAHDNAEKSKLVKTAMAKALAINEVGWAHRYEDHDEFRQIVREAADLAPWRKAIESQSVA